MANIPNSAECDPMLEAAGRAMEAEAATEKPRPYLGMSLIGEACQRKQWYRFRWVSREVFDAKTLRLFEDGHRTESLVIDRLRKVAGLKLIDRDPSTGRQIGHCDIDGHFRGHQDGEILGLLQAPKTWHVFEVKATTEKKFNELKRIILTYGQKAALRKWNPVYHAQGILYCFYTGLTRHYTVVSTPGGRDWLGVRTDAETSAALDLRARAERIIRSDSPPARISPTPDHFECRFCSKSPICHERMPADRNCRTCLHSSPTQHGQWRCARWDRLISEDRQREGCPTHLFIPGIVAGEVIEAGDTYVRYRMWDGEDFVDS